MIPTTLFGAYLCTMRPAGRAHEAACMVRCSSDLSGGVGAGDACLLAGRRSFLEHSTA